VGRRKRLLVILALTVAIFSVIPSAQGPNSAHAQPSTGVYKATDQASWNPDSEVTAVGKAAARARGVLNWVLSIQDAGFAPVASGKNALLLLWERIRNFVVVLYFIILVIVAFGLITHANWAEKSRRQLPMLVVAFVLTFLSFTLEVTVIRFTDRAQDYFYTVHKMDEAGTLNEKHLRAEDLLTVSFSYQDFVGFRRNGPDFVEAARNHLFLVRVTTWTNYAIALIIVLRIIILWGLVIFSPFLFPFLVFPLTKKVAIVWLREYFRWLLLGPLFALFLTAIPFIWRNTDISNIGKTIPEQQVKTSGIPIGVNPGIFGGTEATSSNIYQSGTNILLAPPGSTKTLPQLTSDLTKGNNLSETDTYARYIVALLMLWGAIILPFLLLRIIMGISVEVGRNIQNVWSRSSASQYLSSWQKKIVPPPPAGPKPGPAPVLLREFKEKTVPIAAPAAPKEIHETRISEKMFKEREIEKLSVPALLSLAQLKQAAPEVVEFLAVPAKRTLANLSKLEQSTQSTAVTRQAIDKIAHPEKIADQEEARRYQTIKEAIFMKSVAGEESARALNAAVTQNTTKYLTSDVGREVHSSAAAQFSQSAANVSQLLEQALEHRQDQTSELARRGLTQIKEVTKLASLPLEQFREREVKRVVEISNMLQNPRAIADEQRRTQFVALKKIVNSEAHAGRADARELKSNIRGVLDVAKYLSPDVSREILLSSLKQFAHSALDVVQGIEKKAQEGVQKQDRKALLVMPALNQVKQLAKVGSQPLEKLSDQEIKVGLSLAKKIEDPAQAATPEERSQFDALNEEVEAEATAGDPSALNFQDDAFNFLQSAQEPVSPPAATLDQLQGVAYGDRDFLQSKMIWAEHFRKAPVPLSDTIKSRQDWLRSEIKKYDAILKNLLSGTPEKRDSALKEAQTVLPFVLMGKYQLSEIAQYLLAKFEAAREVLSELTSEQEQKEEESGELVMVKRGKKAAEPKKMYLEQEFSEKPAPAENAKM